MKRLLVTLALACMILTPLALPTSAVLATPIMDAPACPPCPTCPECAAVAAPATPTTVADDTAAAPANTTTTLAVPTASPEDVITRDPTTFFTNLVEAVQSKRWSPVIGSVLLILVWIVRKFLWKKLPKKVVPWIALGIGIVATMGLGMAGGVVWWKALISGLVSGGQAIALWELGSSVIPKRLRNTQSDAKK